MTTHQLKFGRRPTSIVLEAERAGAEAATVRYGDERDIEPGDALECLRSDNGARFADSEVTYVGLVPVCQALDTIESRGAVYGTRRFAVLLDDLAYYYDRPFQARTAVKVICHEVDALNTGTRDAGGPWGDGEW